MKTMQRTQELQTMQAAQESKNRACKMAWHQDSRADFRESSKDFSQRDVSGLDHREGAF